MSSQQQINLGTGAGYAVLAQTNITFNPPGTNTVTGGTIGSGNSTINGSFVGARDDGGVSAAQTGVSSGVSQAVGMTADYTFTGPQVLSTILTGPGKYQINGSLTVSTDTTLTGTGIGTEYYVFIATGGIILNGSVLVNTNQIDPTKVTFISSSTITFQTSSKIYNGTYIANGSVVVSGVPSPTGLQVNGRLISQSGSIGYAGNVNLPTPFCFVKGTKIMTSKGLIAIEDITPDDYVVTSGTIDGNTVSPFEHVEKPVIFVGHYTQTGMTTLTRPIVFSKNSLGENIPSEDVRVSPNHAIIVDNKLVFAKNLLNSDTIYQDMECETVEYYHIMSDKHCTLNACGLWTESLGSETEKFTEYLPKDFKSRNNI